MARDYFSEYYDENHDNGIDISKKDVFPLLKYRKDTKRFADKALNNIIIPFPGFDSVDFDNRYWGTDKKKKYGDSYQLYMQSMRICAELLNEYTESKVIDYLDKAEEIILSWIDYIENGTDEKMVWYDHPTAYRTQVIIQFLYLAESAGKTIDTKLFRAVLLKHAEILGNDEIYKNNNHGLMMDRSLMILGNVLKNENLFYKGYYRAIDTFWYSFSYTGIHLENSPDYHQMVVNMYKEIENYLNSRDKSLGKNVLGYLDRAELYPNILLKPDRSFPAIGDSGSAKRKVEKVYKNLYDEEAGIAIIQYSKPKPLYLSFVCGYSSRVHKHKDDLSINLNYNGVDFFEDPGKYNYSNSKERKYIVSKEAHSTFYLNQFDYSIKPENRFDRKVALTGYEDNKLFTVVQGKNGDYDGSNAILARKAIVFKSAPLILLLDNVTTYVKHNLKFIQNFNLASNVEVEKTNNIYKLKSKNEEISIQQFNKIQSDQIIHGNLDTPIAINTVGFGKAEKTKQIRFENAAKKGNVYCTAIFDDRKVKNVNIEIENRMVTVSFNGTSYVIYQ